MKFVENVGRIYRNYIIRGSVYESRHFSNGRSEKIILSILNYRIEKHIPGVRSTVLWGKITVTTEFQTTTRIFVRRL